MRSRARAGGRATATLAVSSAQADRVAASAKLAGLRNALAAQKLDAFLVPMNDAHSSEYVGEADKRIEWLTGFTLS